MGGSSWAQRQKFKVAAPVLVVAVFALLSAACSFFDDYEVTNRSNEPLLVDVRSTRCEDIGLFPSNTGWSVLDPGAHITLSSFGSNNCLVVAPVDRSTYAAVPAAADAGYIVDYDGRRISITTGLFFGADDDSSLSTGGIILLAVICGPFLIAFVAATLITLVFLYRYFIRGDKTARLGQ